MRRIFERRRKAVTPEIATTVQASKHDLPGPSAAASSLNKTFPSGIKLLHEPEHATVDVVFIHGLTGDREKTWTAHGASEPWPKALLPTKLPTARILTFGYDAYVTDWRRLVSQNRIGNHSWKLLTSLATYREEDETNDRPLIFVCHSLGGLVCEDALVTSRQRPERHLQNILQSTRGIAFLGTPHHGSGLARWAELVSRHIGLFKQTNTEIVAVLQRESEVLARIQDGFHTMVIARGDDGQGKIEITCFFEELPLRGIGQVVPQGSAILPGYIPIGIHSNHMDMARFVSTDDPGFTAVCGELRRWTQQIGESDIRQNNKPGSNTTQNSTNGQDKQDKLDGRLESTAHFLVPYTSNSDFVGRSEILERLKWQLGHGQPSTGGTWQPRACLYGLGGIGKTQIALAYVFWLRETHPDISIFWVHASTAERFRQAYTSIAQECQIAGYDDPMTNMLPLVKKWLERKDRGRWLMVIDNADDKEVFFGQKTGSAVDEGFSGHEGNLGRYIPQCAHGAILVTTRNLQTGSSLTKGKHLIEVGKMNEDETAQLLHIWLDGVDTTSGAEFSTLSTRLEHLPLALVQATAFIRENGLTIDAYLELLEKGDQNLVDLLGEEFETEGRDSETPHAVAETWMLSFEQIQRQNPFAGELLSIMSLFDRHAIPLEFLSQYSQQRGRDQNGEIELTKALGILKAFCFVTEDKGHGFDMHRLIQLVTQTWLSRKGMNRQFEEQALLLVSEVYPFGSHETRAVCSAYLPHANAVLQSNKLGTKKESIIRASLLHSIGGLYYYQGHWKDAEDVSNQAAEIRKAVLGEEHPDTLASIAHLASIYWKQGRIKEAEDLEVQVVEARKRVLGEEHPNTLNSIANLALTYCDQGRWKEAENLGVQVVEARKSVLGEEHLHTLNSMANLASTYKAQGRWKEAENLEVQVVEARKSILGEEHPDTLTSKSNVSLTYWNQGRWKEAEDLGVQVVEASKRVLGEEHPDTLNSISNLASTYWSQGRLKEAEELEVQVVDARKRVLGEEHPDTLNSIANLALTYCDQGRWKEAENLGVQVVEARKRVLGEEHPDTLNSMANLASTYKTQGRQKEAENLEVQVVEARKRVLGEEHPDTLTSKSNVSLTYWNQGRWKEAEELEVQVVEARKRVLGEEHPDTLNSISNLASTYWSQGRLKEAEELEVQVVDARKRVLGEEHPDTLNSIANLASTYHDQGRLMEAENLGVQVVETRKRVLGEEHPDTLNSMANLASTYKTQGRWEEAENLEVQVVEARKRVFGEEHPDTLTSKSNLASTYWCQGRLKEAEELEVQVVEKRKRVWGEKHPSTLSTMANLAVTWKSQGRLNDAVDLMETCFHYRQQVLGKDHPETASALSLLTEWQKDLETGDTQ